MHVRQANNWNGQRFTFELAKRLLPDGLRWSSRVGSSTRCIFEAFERRSGSYHELDFIRQTIVSKGTKDA